MSTPKDPISAFRGAGRGTYSVAKLIDDRRKDRADEAQLDRCAVRQKRHSRELQGKTDFRKNYDLKTLRKFEPKS